VLSSSIGLLTDGHRVPERSVEDTPTAPAPTRIFVSYAHEDDSHRQQLANHLSQLSSEGLIEIWDDRRIPPGDEWDDAITDAMERADVILLLVSSDLLASRYIRRREMARAMERHEAGEAQVVPIIVRRCDWHSAPFGRLQALPREARAISTWEDTDSAWTDVARRLRVMLSSPSAPAVATPAPARRESSEEAIDSMLRALAELKQDPTVAEIIDRNRDELEAAEERIERVAYYKRLHDVLHRVHEQSFKQLSDNAPLSDETRITLEGASYQLEALVRELPELIASAPPRVRTPSDIRSLEGIAGDIATAIQASEPIVFQSHLDELARQLKLLPGMIDAKLTEAASNLDVPRTAKALSRLCETLGSHGLEADRMGRLKAGTRDLAELGEHWDSLVHQHGRWEDVERRLRDLDVLARDRNADTLSDDDLNDFQRQWQILQPEARSLVAGAGDHSNYIDRAAQAFDRALNEGNRAGVLSHFLQFRTAAGAVFFRLDEDLKNLCPSMLRVGERLQALL
jgi:hypothetical protein